RYTTDYGANWKDLPFRLNPKSDETMKSLAAGPGGTIYLVGQSVNAEKKTTGFVITFNGTETKLMDKVDGAEFNNIYVDKAETVYVVGDLVNDRGQKRWLVRKKAVGVEKWEDLGSLFPNEADTQTMTTLGASFIKKPLSYSGKANGA